MSGQLGIVAPERTTQRALGIALYSPKLPVVVRLERAFNVLLRVGFLRYWLSANTDVIMELRKGRQTVSMS